MRHVGELRTFALKLWSGSAKSPCRGFATRILSGIGQHRSRFFCGRPQFARIYGGPPFRIGERGMARLCWRAEAVERGASEFAISGQVLSEKPTALARGNMLGRHVYRVHPTEERWIVTKEGESEPRASFASREQALAEARRLADADQPSKVTLDNGDGIILDEQLFGRDLSQEIGA
jgi:hypothetical protein